MKNKLISLLMLSMVFINIVGCYDVSGNEHEKTYEQEITERSIAMSTKYGNKMFGHGNFVTNCAFRDCDIYNTQTSKLHMLYCSSSRSNCNLVSHRTH